MNRNALPPAVKQNDDEATYAHKLKKTDGLVNWADPVLCIHRRLRAYTPWPGAYTFLPERFRKKGMSGRLVILKAEIVGKLTPEQKSALPGEIIALEKRGPVVRCGDSALLLLKVKPEGSGEMDGAAFLRGRALALGEQLLPA
jgi:methionyl-tRNA formyltransferase